MNRNRYQVIYVNENNERVMDVVHGNNEEDVKSYLRLHFYAKYIVSIKNLGKGY